MLHQPVCWLHVQSASAAARCPRLLQRCAQTLRAILSSRVPLRQAAAPQHRSAKQCSSSRWTLRYMTLAKHNTMILSTLMTQRPLQVQLLLTTS